MPRSGEWLVTSNRLDQGTPREHVRIFAIHPSGRVRRLLELEEKIVMGNGGTTDFVGGAYLLSQGWHDESGSVWHIDPDLCTARRVGPPEGLVLNSPNDIVLHPESNSLLFTDPAYGFEAQGFRTTFHDVKAVWVTSAERQVEDDEWRVMHAGCTEQPNGVLVSCREWRARMAFY